MKPTSYLRYPHVSPELVTFVAEDDVWMAPLEGGRAWRVSGMGLPARGPRFTPDGSALVWSVVQGSAPEIVTAGTDGGGFRQLSYWGHPSTRVRGFTPDGQVVAISAHAQVDARHTWARSVPLDGGPSTVLPYGPVDSVVWGPSVGDERPLVVGSALSREPAHWKRYRGGTAGKLWIDRDGGGGFERLAPELDGNLCDPVWIGGRIAFLSDHEGYGNVYSVAPDGTGLRRHTDHGHFYARHLSSDGTRLVYEHRGRLFVLDSLDAEARRLEIHLGSAGHGRRRRPLAAARHLGTVVPDHDGAASLVETHGTLHLLKHRDGPSHTIEATPGVRARLGRILGGHTAAYIADHGGEEALHLRAVDSDGDFGSFGPIPSAHDDELDAVPAAPQAPAPAPEPGGSLPAPVSAAAVTGADAGIDAAASPAGTCPEDDGAHDGTGTGHGRIEVPGAADPAGTDDATGGDGLRRIPLPTRGRVRSLEASPDGRWIAIGTEYGEVQLLDVAEGSWRGLCASDFGGIDHVSFSPDSAWLAWIEPVTEFEGRSRVMLTRASSADAAIQVTDGRFHDHSPSFSHDGRYLAFLSERSFDPVYDTHSFDLSFPASTKPFMVALAEDTPSLFGPSAYSARPAGAPPAEAEGAGDAADDAGAPVRGDGAAGSGTGGRPAPAQTRVDAEGIGQRLFAVPVAQGRYSRLVAVEKGLLWLVDESTGVTGDGRVTGDSAPALRLERFDYAERRTTTLVKRLDRYRVSPDKKRLVYVDGQQVRSVPVDRSVDKEAPESQALDLLRIRVELDPAKVWEQAYDEAWRLQRDFFWAEDMAGLDWEAIGAKYRPLLARLGSHDDLVDVLLELHGELGTSHAYVVPFAAQEPGAGRQGLLGADLSRVDGAWRVATVLEGESSDPQAYSPLAAPGVAVRAGDEILAVDGRLVPFDGGPEVLLDGAGGRTVELTVRNGPESRDPGTVRRVAVVPVKDEQRLRYQNWVNANRRTVREASGGTFGYLHIPDMMAHGWAQLHRDLDTETALDALVVDVRRNRGGHTSQLVAELLGRKVTAWSIARETRTGTYPSSAPRGPVVVITDEWAGSDGDIITQVAKLRAIGPVVGVRTWGGVIGIDNLFALADGTKVTQPRYATWFTGGIGWGVENRGVDPDIEVGFPPHAYAAGEDPQLEQGVAILKEMLREIPTQRPPEQSGYRALTPPPLPPRPQGGAGAEAVEDR
ncbi:S41 family peptidase [Zafaria sp. Z1313]|uniref:S41 family peptidase n=1 Tax=unclassified Zafaria TaxID=2828765 RepID=UPI002E7A034C|nr:S41 family peptidase [Zafaria sp. J156]MEE1620260.1 S41 family peptidase [Zafaria sp. J156]